MGTKKFTVFIHFVDKNGKKWDSRGCFNEASKYSTPAEWLENSYSSYHAAIRNHWFDSIIKYEFSPNKLDLKSCIRDAQNYSSMTEWRKNSLIIYLHVRLKKWDEECTTHMQKWTLESCIAVAQKYSSFKEWIKNDSISHSEAKRNKWLQECKSHFTKKSVSKKNYYVM